MARRLFTLLSALSLLLSVATVVLWVRSHYVYEHVARVTQDGGAYVVRSGRGRMFFDHRSRWQTARGWERLNLRTYPSWPDCAYDRTAERPDGVLGFAAYRGTQYTWPGHLHGDPWPLPPRTDPRWWSDRYRALAVPHWAVVGLAGILPARRLLQLAARRRRPGTGLCPTCGYDLRATPGRCPECGTSAHAAR
jgi:hypothetical protein